TCRRQRARAVGAAASSRPGWTGRSFLRLRPQRVCAEHHRRAEGGRATSRRHRPRRGRRLPWPSCSRAAPDARRLHHLRRPHPVNPTQLDASDVVLHNDDDAGWWLIIEGRVYDVTGFTHLHPGGAKIVRAYGGVDATRPYRAVSHHVDLEVDALLGLYEIGV